MNTYQMIDWNKADVNSSHGTNVLKRALNKYFGNKQRENIEHVKHFTMRGDFPADGAPYMEHITREIGADLGWMSVFKTIDFTTGDGAGGESGFDVLTKGSGLVLQQVNDGDAALVYQAQGDSVRIPFVTYSGGLLYIRTLIQDGRWWDLEDTFGEIGNAYNEALAASHYDLLDAMGAGIDLAWQAPTPAALPDTDANFVISRDSNTINEAIIQIIDGADGWQGINASTQFAVVCPLELAQRCRQAVASDQYGVKRVGFNVAVYPTTYLAANDEYYVVPYQKAGRSGLRQSLEVEFDNHVLQNAQTACARGRWGAAIIGGDLLVRRCATA